MAKTAKAKDYTHSVWSGKKYDRAQTVEQLTAESKSVLAANRATRKGLVCDDETMRRLFGAAFKAKK